MRLRFYYIFYIISYSLLAGNPISKVSYQAVELSNCQRIDELRYNIDPENMDYSIINSEHKNDSFNKPQNNREKKGSLRGKIVDTGNKPLLFANIFISENNYGTTSNGEGQYSIKKLTPGTYTLNVSYLGYRKETKIVEIYPGKTTEVDFILKTTSFNIGSIEVVGEKDFIPLDVETKTKISSGEIEHMQAASLNDVLELMPGVATTNPTLNSAEQASIRGGSSIGTQILIDGIPISNQANMQTGIGYSTTNSGVDLRSIPAENIESVEIIRGIPSAKYGDLIDGAIIVETKSLPAPLKTKVKYNPDVFEANISGGLKLGNNWILNGNFNVASSDRNIKVEGDGYMRIASQLNLVYSNNNLKFNNYIYFTRTFDELTEQPGYAAREAWYNRDVTFKYSGNFNYIFNSLSQLNFDYSVNYTKRNSYEQNLVSRDNIVISDRIDEGAQEGVIVFGSYLGKKWVKGSEWNIYTNLDYETGLFIGDFFNKFSFGINWKNDFNKGEGIIFDPLKPPYLAYNTPRLRSYDDLPSYNTLSFYFEDKIAGRFIKPFTLQVGFRYEVYRPKEINFGGLFGTGDFIESYNGTFFNPRINLSYNLFEDTQLRFGYGVTSKSPPMSMIFAQDKYVDIVDTTSVVDITDPTKNFSIISTYKYHIANENLKGYKQFKYEASLDQKIGPVGFTLTAYANNTKDMFMVEDVPITLHKKSFFNWPDQENYSIKDTSFNSYSRYVNNGEMTSKGIEFAFRTKKIPAINTIFIFDGSYSFIEFKNNKKTYGAERYIEELNGRVQPFYDPIESSKKSLLFNYRFDIQAKSLGMWITVHLQQDVLKILHYTSYDSVAIGYYTAGGETVNIPVENRNDPKYSKLTNFLQEYELNDEKYPNLFLLNIKVSKTLWENAAISFFVNNLLNNNPLYRFKRKSSQAYSYDERNPYIFYGMEFQARF